MKAFRQHVDEEAADEFRRRQRHGLVARGAIAAVILVAEGDPGLIQGDQPAVGDGDPVGVAGEIGQKRLRPSEGLPDVNHPLLLPQWREITLEGTVLDQILHVAEEAQLPGGMEGR